MEDPVPTSASESLLKCILQLPEPELAELIQNLDDDDADAIDDDWPSWAHPAQLPPGGDWRTWLFLGGRGAGKTRAGAEWVRGLVMDGCARTVALVGATYADVRGVMIEGESGLLTLGRHDRLLYEPSKRLLSWPGGAIARIFSAEAPDGIRGHQFDAAWCDEFAKWSNAHATLDMLNMALRTGADPRMVVTTTPRRTDALLDLMTTPGTVQTTASTYTNAANLAASFIKQMKMQYAGTRLGRQELDAELIEDNDNALWKREWFEAHRVAGVPIGVVRIVVGVDPSVGNGQGAECGIVVAGKDGEGRGYVLADRSVHGLTPVGWSERVARAHNEFNADAVIVETNQGGDAVKAILRQALPNAAIRAVNARAGKRTRAEPVAALYERGQVSHCGVFLELEDQLCTWDGASGAPSPDRLDALVWALSDLFPANAPAKPRVRAL